MGFFSSEKIVSVGSSVYNLAGEEKDRPQYLSSLVIGNVLSGTKDSMGDTIIQGYLNGPTSRLRQFFRWADKEENYDTVGMPTGKIRNSGEIHAKKVETYIPHAAGTQVWSQYAESGNAEYGYWAEQWIMLYRPGELNKAWAATYDSGKNQITIKFSDNSTQKFTPYNFFIDATYIYIYYIIITNPESNLTIKFSTDQLMIYRVGSGQPGLDSLVNVGSDYGEFFPFIPVRIDNEFLSEKYESDAYEQAGKAYKKATGGDFDELIDSLKDTKDLDDIDYTYVVFGVSLNVVEMACKRYLYTFFEKLMFTQDQGPEAYGRWQASTNAALKIFNDWHGWKIKNDIHQGGSRGLGRGGPDPGPEPARPNYPAPPKNTIRIRSKGTLDTNYDISLSWTFITNGTGQGKGRPGAKRNDCWIEHLGTDKSVSKYYTESATKAEDTGLDSDKFRIYWQKASNAYIYLDVVGMVHRNDIYDGESVTIGSKEALKDADESGFIIPLHYQTWRDTPIIDTSQMATACVFVVVNAYEITEQKWYEKGIFRIFLIIVLAIASVLFTGGAGIGLLGAHLSVGAALGFSGMTAAIVGSVINAMAALVLTTILEKLTGSLGVLGPIIGAIVGILVGNLIQSFQAGGSFAINWSQFLKADNLLKLTSAAGDGIKKMYTDSTLAIQEEMTALDEQYNSESLKIQEAYYEQFGYGQVVIDPIALFVDSTTIYAESPSTFLGRTTLTGSDIVEMSQDMLYNFAEYSLTLPDAFV